MKIKFFGIFNRRQTVIHRYLLFLSHVKQNVMIDRAIKRLVSGTLWIIDPSTLMSPVGVVAVDVVVVVVDSVAVAVAGSVVVVVVAITQLFTHVTYSS